MAEARLFYESDCNLDVLSGKTVAIVGFGSQGHAHALNLHESGVNVIVGLYKGSKSWKKVEDLGLKVMETADAVKAADIVMVLAPDEKQAAIYKMISNQTLQKVWLLHLLTALTFTSSKSFHLQMQMYL